MPDIEDALLDDVLCFISSAKHSLTREEIIKIAVAFYKPEVITKSKEVICKLSSVCAKKRIACKSHPNPAVADLEDIMKSFDKHEDGSIALPKFLSDGYAKMPPCSGFEGLSSILCSLRDELAAQRFQLEEVKKSHEKDMKSFENVGSIIQDVSELKMLVIDLPNNLSLNSPEATPVISPPSSEESRSSQNSERPNGETPPLNSDGLHGNDVTRDSAHRQNDQQWQTVVNRNNGRRRTRSFNNSRLTQQQNQRTPSQMRRGDPPINVQRQFSRRGNIAGTRQSAGGLSTAPKILDVFLGGCGQDTDPNAILEYCRREGVEPKKCEPLQTRSDFRKSYKISVLATDRDKLLDAEFWPQGFYVGKYYRPRSVINNESR